MDYTLTPKQSPSVDAIKEILTQRFSPEYKVAILPLNRRRIRVRKGWGVLVEVNVSRKKIKIQNSTVLIMILFLVIFLPLAVYFFCKRKEAQELTHQVYETLKAMKGIEHE